MQSISDDRTRCLPCATKGEKRRSRLVMTRSDLAIRAQDAKSPRFASVFSRRLVMRAPW